MTAGDVRVYGPFESGSANEISAGLISNVTANDLMTVHTSKGRVYYTVVKAA